MNGEYTLEKKSETVLAEEISRLRGLVPEANDAAGELIRDPPVTPAMRTLRACINNSGSP